MFRILSILAKPQILLLCYRSLLISRSSCQDEAALSELRNGYCHRTTTSVNSVLATVQEGESALSEWGSRTQEELAQTGKALNAMGSAHAQDLAGWRWVERTDLAGDTSSVFRCPQTFCESSDVLRVFSFLA